MGWLQNKIDNYLESRIEKIRSDNETLVETQVEDSLLSSLILGNGITENQALSIPSVASSLDKISNAVAMLPIKLYKFEKNPDGKFVKKEIVEDMRTFLLNKTTGDTLNPFQIKKRIVIDYLLNGRAYIFKQTKFNDVVSIKYVAPSNVQPLKNVDPIYKTTVLNVQGKTYENFCFVSLLRNTQDGATGEGVLQEIEKALETAYQTMLFELGLAKKGGNKKGFLIAKQPLDPKKLEELKKAWSKLYKNENDKEDNVIVLNNGVEFKESSATSVELQLDERKKTLSDEIKNIFHDDVDNDKFVKNAVMPIIVAIESSLNENFLLEDEKKTHFFKFETKDLIRGSLKDRYEAYKIASETGWITKNEIRESEDKDPVEGLDIISMNLADVVYNVKTKSFYTPNTGDTKEFEEGEDINET